MMFHEMNLLPPMRQRVLRQNLVQLSIIRFLRRTTFALLAVAVVGCVAAAVLFSLTQFGTENMNETLQGRIAYYQQLRETISGHNLTLKEMDTLSKSRVEWSLFIQKVLEVLPPGTELTTINAELGRRQVIIEGTAVSRGALVVLEERLRAMSEVQDVLSPPSNLIQRSRPGFTFTLTLKQSL